MGIFYTGDITGRFNPNYQSTDAPNRFGVEGRLIRYDQSIGDFVIVDDNHPKKADDVFELGWSFQSDHLEKVEKELESLILNLDINFNHLKDFSDQNESYSLKQLKNYFKNTYQLDYETDTLQKMLKEYADYLLGRKIADCIKSKGKCVFHSTDQPMVDSTLTRSTNTIAGIFKIIAWIYIGFVVVAFLILANNLPTDFLGLAFGASLLTLGPALLIYAIGEVIDLLSQIRDSLRDRES
jgi:hypothetical protein